MFKDVKEVIVNSKSLGSFSVDTSGLIYSPAHHNFSWSYVIDLNFVKGTDDQIQKIKAKYGRFIVVTKKTDSEMVASFYSNQNNGVEKFKLIKEIKMKNVP